MSNCRQMSGQAKTNTKGFPECECVCTDWGILSRITANPIVVVGNKLDSILLLDSMFSVCPRRAQYSPLSRHLLRALAVLQTTYRTFD